MKKLIFFIILILPVFVFAQKTIKHIVAANESLSSIAAKYNVTVKALAATNKLDAKKGLVLGQVLKVQLSAGAKPIVVKEVKEKVLPKEKPIAKEKPANLEAPVSASKAPTMHTVSAKETLYGISKMYGVKVAEIKKWNNLTADGVDEGMELIVGYGTKSKVIKTKTEEKPKIEDQSNTIEPSVKKETTKKENDETNVDPKYNSTGEEQTGAKNFNGGYFKSLYKDNEKKMEGTAGIFKSTSGWDDSKYYCLHNTVKSGTIIKVTNVSNGKSIFAKVLDIMPDLKQNDKLLLRISNAAADALGETTASTMNVAISY